MTRGNCNVRPIGSVAAAEKIGWSADFYVCRNAAKRPHIALQFPRVLR